MDNSWLMIFLLIFLTEFMLDVTLVSFVYRTQLKDVSRQLTGLLVVLFALMTLFYLEQSNVPIILEVPAALVVSSFGFLLLYRFSQIRGMQLALTAKVTWDKVGDIGSLVRNTDVFLAICSAVLIPFLVSVLVSRELSLAASVLVAAVFAVTYFALAMRYTFNRSGPSTHRLENALSGLFYFNFLFAALLYGVLFIGITDVSGNYATGATVAAIVFVVPISAGSYYMGKISRRAITQSKGMAELLIKYRWRSLVASAILVLVISDFPLAYWIYTNLAETSLFIWMIGLVYYLAQIVSRTLGETLRMKIELGLTTESQVRDEMHSLGHRGPLKLSC